MELHWNLVTSCQSTVIDSAGQCGGCLPALPSVGPDSYLTVNLVGNTQQGSSIAFGSRKLRVIFTNDLITLA